MKLNKSSRASVDFNKVAVFCQVVESGNYQRASEVLHVTPSALSQAISSLEYALGFPVFERRGRRLVPNENGVKLHREFRQRQNSFFDVLEEIRGEEKKVNGVLRLGAYLEFAKTRLTGVIKEFTSENAAADVKLVFDSPSRLNSLLHHGHLDLCFSIFASDEKKTIRSTALLEEELVLVAAPRILPANPSLDDILDAPIIDYFYNHLLMKRWLALHFQKRVKKLPVRIFAATAEMVVALVSEGAGIGVVPRYLVSGDLKIVRPTAKRLLDYIWLLERADIPPSTAHVVFREQVFRQFKAATHRH